MTNPMNVVNGGLIDFQDNLQRGVQEYVTPSMLLQQHGGFGQPQLQQLASLATQQTPTSFTAGQIQPGQMLCGPASFLHVNGVTYKPVEEPTSKLHTAPDMSPTAVTAQGSNGAAGSNPPRVLSERELREAIDKRVKQQVMSYVRNQHDGVAGSTEVLLSAEEVAARKVLDLNANMTAGRREGKGKRLQSRW